MKKSELRNLIREEILKLDIDYILENYSDLYDNYPGEWFNIGWVFLAEYRINLSDTYTSTKVEDNVVTGYEFYDSNEVRHLSLLQKGTDIIKIGPALSNDKSILKINFKKRPSGADDRLLSTHINNIFTIISDNNLKSMSFSPEDDEYKEVRKRLFVNIINKYKDKISDIKVNGDETRIIFK